MVERSKLRKKLELLLTTIFKNFYLIAWALEEAWAFRLVSEISENCKSINIQIELSSESHTNLCFFSTTPGEFFASKLEFNDFGVVAVDEPSLLCAKAEFLLSIIVLVSGVVS